MIRRCWIALYDAKGRIIDLHPPPPEPWTDGIIGTPVWEIAAQEHQEGLRAVFLHVIQHQVGVVWDGLDAHGTWWRLWLYPMRRAENHGASVAAIVRKWPDAVASLKPIDRVICASIAGGMLNKQIAAKLNVGISTVHHHRNRIADLLGLPLAALPGWCGLHEEWLG